MEQQIQANWYQCLLLDIRGIEFQSIVIGKWKIGKRILEDESKFGKPEYGSKRIENLAKDLGGSSGDLWHCIKFAKKFPNSLPAGENLENISLENLSWRKIKNQFLYTPQHNRKLLTTSEPKLPKGKYNIIYADPPWTFYAGGYKNQSQHYDTMSIKEICDLPIKDLSADNCILFLWVTFPILPDAFKVIEAWEFSYSTIGFVWIKTNKNKKGFFFGLGSWTRSNTELCLIATKGNIKRKDASISQIIYEPIESHSKKPDIVREKITQLVGELPRIELFARGTPPEGWVFWGSEALK